MQWDIIMPFQFCASCSPLHSWRDGQLFGQTTKSYKTPIIFDPQAFQTIETG